MLEKDKIKFNYGNNLIIKKLINININNKSIQKNIKYNNNPNFKKYLVSDKLLNKYNKLYLKSLKLFDHELLFILNQYDMNPYSYLNKFNYYVSKEINNKYDNDNVNVINYNNNGDKLIPLYEPIITNNNFYKNVEILKYIDNISNEKLNVLTIGNQIGNIETIIYYRDKYYNFICQGL